MSGHLSRAQQALADYDEARADYMRFLSMDPPDYRAVDDAMVAMDEAHVRFKQAMGDLGSVQPSATSSAAAR